MPDETLTEVQSRRTVIPSAGDAPPNSAARKRSERFDLTMSVQCPAAESDEAVRVWLAGEFDLSHCDEFMDALETVYADKLELNLHELQFIDSSGIRALIMFKKRVDLDGGAIKIELGTSPVARTFELAGLMRILGIADPAAPQTPNAV